MSAAAKRRPGRPPGYAKYLPAIFAAARERGISNEEIHDAIAVGFKKESLKQLTAEECRRLLDGMRGKQMSKNFTADRRSAMNAHGRKDYDATADTVYLVNDSELRMMREAAELRGWSEATLRAFVRRQLGVDSPRTMVEFNKVFWALKAMNRRDDLCA